MSGFRRLRVLLFLSAGLWFSMPDQGRGTLLARPPEIRSVNLRGLQLGAATVLTIDGTDLLPEPRVYLNEQLLGGTVDPTSSPSRVILSVTAPETIPPGIAQFRVATAEGYSNSMLFGLDRLPNAVISEEITATQVALHGSVPGSGISKVRFPAKAGEELMVEVEARRLGSKLRPVLHVFDEKRVQIAWAMPRQTLLGDSRIKFQAPRDGKYTLELHDLQYAPPGPSFFRMKIGRWQFVDLAFPPVVRSGQESSVELLGNSSGIRVTVKPTDALRTLSVPLPQGLELSSPSPVISVSDLPELVENNTAESPQLLPAAPVAISGRLDAGGQRDRFLLPVTPGTKFNFEVFAERIGSRVDTILEIKNKAGNILAVNDDGPDTIDSRLDFTVPAATDALEIVLRDNLEIASPEALYRLVITMAETPGNDYRLDLKADVVNVPAGEFRVLEALVIRQGYRGPLQIEPSGLPAGVTLAGAEIPAGANGTLLSFSGAVDSPAALLVSRLRAKAPDGTLFRVGTVPPAADDRTPPWLREHIGVALTPKPVSPFQLTWANPESLAQLPLASKQPLVLNLVRPASTFGPVRLSVVTSQPVPSLNGQPNATLSVRGEQILESPIDPAVKTAGDALAMVEKQVAEAMKGIQTAQGDAKVAAEAKLQDVLKQKATAEAALREAEAKAKYAPQLSLIIPSTLSESLCDISVKGELLNPERNTVLRTTFAAVRRIPILNPLVVKLSGSPVLETKLDPKTGAVVKVTGTIERLAGYAGAVTISLGGIPAGASAANVTVNGDQTQFVIDLKLPANFAPTEVKDLKLSATGPADPLSSNLPVRSSDLELSLKINQ